MMPRPGQDHRWWPWPRGGPGGADGADRGATTRGQDPRFSQQNGEQKHQTIGESPKITEFMTKHLMYYEIQSA
jgi:hypothetical protein